MLFLGCFILEFHITVCLRIIFRYLIEDSSMYSQCKITQVIPHTDVEAGLDKLHIS